MSFPARLLENVVPARTPFNTRVPATLVQQLLDLDADTIKLLWDPANCPEDCLPFLAWAFSVDIWNNNWDIAKKRAVTAAAFVDHKHKGTQFLIGRYLEYVGSELIQTVAPPARAFYAGGFSGDGDRLSWLSSLPQVRFYPFLTTRTPPKARAFYSADRSHKSFYRDPTIGNASFMQASEGKTLAATKVTFVKNGVETPVSYELLSDPTSGTVPVRVLLQGPSRAQFYGTAHYGTGFMLESDANDNVVSVRFSGSQGSRFSIAPGSKITDVQPYRVSQTRPAPVGLGFYGVPTHQRFMNTTQAGSLIYDQVSILDPTDVLFDQRRKTRFFYGFSRYGIAAFTAELAVRIPMTRPRSRLGTFYAGFMQKADMTPVSDALMAIGYAKSLRDTILVDTEIYRTLRLSDQKTLGTFTLGQTIKVK